MFNKNSYTTYGPDSTSVRFFYPVGLLNDAQFYIHTPDGSRLAVVDEVTRASQEELFKMDGLQYTSKRVNIKIALRPKTVEIVFHATGTFDRRFEGTKFCAIFTTPYGSDIKGSVRESDGFLTTKVKDMNCKVLVFKDVTIPN